MILCNGLCFLLTTQIRDFEGTSREVNKYISKMEDRARQEEELFNRVPLTREERKRDKYMKKATNGYGEGLIICFYKSIKCMMTFF
jgi:U3 small nucleolar ribonucleoprotein protein LCP5